MNNSTIFKKAHEMTKATVKAGDDYRATFAVCLKIVIKQAKQPKPSVWDTIETIIEKLSFVIPLILMATFAGIIGYALVIEGSVITVAFGVVFGIVAVMIAFVATLEIVE